MMIVHTYGDFIVLPYWEAIFHTYPDIQLTNPSSISVMPSTRLVDDKHQCSKWFIWLREACALPNRLPRPNLIELATTEKAYSVSILTCMPKLICHCQFKYLPNVSHLINNQLLQSKGKVGYEDQLNVIYLKDFIKYGRIPKASDYATLKQVSALTVSYRCALRLRVSLIRIPLHLQPVCPLYTRPTRPALWTSHTTRK